MLSIRDRGIGMTKQQLKENLGTIAKSGTSAFLETMQKGGDMNLIGQFGVGFYSVYLVADYVQVVSKHNDETSQWVWESAADGAFSVSEDVSGEALGRGTQINIFLKEDALEYAEPTKLKDLVTRYSEFINFPIYLHAEKTVSKEVPVEAEEAPAAAAEGEEDVEDEDEEEKPTTRTVTETVREWELLNDNKALWLRPAADIGDEEYSKFYKALTKDFAEPLTHTHFRAEGDVEFKSILFVPSKAEPNLFDNYYNKAAAMKLYVRRVFISDEFNELLPKYLSFIKGIVDSDSLPLNVSRENLQQHSSLKTIKKKLVRKALDMLRKLADDAAAALEAAKEAAGEGEDSAPPAPVEDKYETFWKSFGKALKLGIIDDASNRVRLAKLLRFTSSQSEGKLTSLEAYVGRMKPWQKQIFFLTGESEAALKASPFLERLLAKDVEVIFLTDPIDEYMMGHLTEFEDFKFQGASKEDLKIGDEKDEDVKKEEKAVKERFKPFTAWWKALLPSADVEAVKVSQRLASTPCVVVSSKYGWSANMEKIMKSQALGDDSKASYMRGRRTLEINPKHTMVRELRAAFAADPESADAKTLATVLYETALLESGYSLEDTKGFAARVLNLAKGTLSVDADAHEAAELVAESEAAKEKAAAKAKAAAEAAEAEAAGAEAAEAPAHDEL